jgi:hypothetical protein
LITFVFGNLLFVEGADEHILPRLPFRDSDFVRCWMDLAMPGRKTLGSKDVDLVDDPATRGNVGADRLSGSLWTETPLTEPFSG